MSIYHVMIDDVAVFEQVKEKLNAKYPDHYYYHGQERLVFVRSDNISEEIVKNIGLGGEGKIEGASGAVFKMNTAYSGYTNGSVWEWLTKYDR